MNLGMFNYYLILGMQKVKSIIVERTDYHNHK